MKRNELLEVCPNDLWSSVLGAAAPKPSMKEERNANGEEAKLNALREVMCAESYVN